MAPVNALVISQDPDSEATAAVTGALEREGGHVEVTPPRAVPAPRGPGDLDAEVVLISSAVDPREVDALLRLAGAGESPVCVLVFADGGTEELEAYVRAGLDYLAPPYTPTLVRRRLTTCRDRHRLTRTVADATSAAALAQIRHELQIGREIQQGFLPLNLPYLPGWEIEASFEPAHVVAGDFYDAFEIAGGRRIGFLIADVCDKGVGAALFMALIRSLLRHTAEASSAGDLGTGVAQMASTEGLSQAAGPGAYRRMLSLVGAGPLFAAVSGTNAYMTRNHLDQGYFATLFFGVLDPENGAVVYINGGHNPPVILRGGEVTEVLEPTGPAVGMFPDSSFSLGVTRMDPGDLMFLYTDGVTEAKDEEGGFFSDTRMVQTLCSAEGTALGTLDRVGDRLRGFRGRADQFDDITMMALRRLPEKVRR